MCTRALYNFEVCRKSYHLLLIYNIAFHLQNDVLGIMSMNSAQIPTGI